MHFAAIDWLIVVVYLAASVAIGLLGKKYIGSVSHYLVAGRELGTHAGIATLAATEIGTITFMYNAELGYRYGFAAFAAALISGIVMARGGELATPGEIAIVGTERDVVARLRAYADAGATEIAAAPIGLGADPAAARRRALEFLGSLHGQF